MCRAGHQTWAGQRCVGRRSVSAHPEAAGAGKHLGARARAGSSLGSAKGSCGTPGTAFQPERPPCPVVPAHPVGVGKKALWTLAPNSSGRQLCGPPPTAVGQRRVLWSQAEPRWVRKTKCPPIPGSPCLAAEYPFSPGSGHGTCKPSLLLNLHSGVVIHPTESHLRLREVC